MDEINDIYDFEEIIELKKLGKRLIILFIICGIMAIPSIQLTISILQNNLEINKLVIYIILSILILPTLVITGFKYIKQLEIVEIEILKKALLKNSNREEFITEEEKKNMCQNFEEIQNDSSIKRIKHILRINNDYKKIDLFLYDFEKEYKNKVETNRYFTIITEINEIDKNEFEEKYKEFLIEKNKKFNLDYSLKIKDNKIIFSIWNFEKIIIKDLYKKITNVGEFLGEIINKIKDT